MMNELKMCDCGEPTYSYKCSLCIADESCLPTQPKREWVDMTDEQMQQTRDDANASFRAWNRGIRGQQFVPQDDPMWHFWKAIQNKLKELNT